MTWRCFSTYLRLLHFWSNLLKWVVKHLPTYVHRHLKASSASIHRPLRWTEWSPSTVHGPPHSGPVETGDREKHDFTRTHTHYTEKYVLNVPCFLTENLIFSSFIRRLSLAASNLQSTLLSSATEIRLLRLNFSMYWWKKRTNLITHMARVLDLSEMFLALTESDENLPLTLSCCWRKTECFHTGRSTVSETSEQKQTDSCKDITRIECMIGSVLLDEWL